MIPTEGILLKTKASSGIQARLIRGCRATSSPRVQLSLQLSQEGYDACGMALSRYAPRTVKTSIDVVELFKELKRRKLIPCSSKSTTSSKGGSTNIVEPFPSTLDQIPEDIIPYILSAAKTKRAD